jgi:hypothetical protein
VLIGISADMERRVDKRLARTPIASILGSVPARERV